MQNLTGQEMMSYQNGNLMAGGTSVYGQASTACINTYDYFYHYYPQWYPSYQYVNVQSKIEQAFKIVGKLLEKDLIEKELTVKQFMKLVNEIAEII